MLGVCLGPFSLALRLPSLANLLGLPSLGPQGLALSLTASLVPRLLGLVWLGVTRAGKR